MQSLATEMLNEYRLDPKRGRRRVCLGAALLAISTFASFVPARAFSREDAPFDQAEVVKGAQFGLRDDPSCEKDQKSALDSAISAAAGKRLILPKGTICVKSTIEISAARGSLEGAGEGTMIKWAAAPGSTIAPVIDVLSSAQGFQIHDIAIDHNASGSTYADSAYFGPNVWGDVAVVIEADSVVIHDVHAENGFDNCIGVGAMNRATNKPFPNKPSHVILNNIHTKNCGSGVHAASRGGPGRIGAGIDLGSASSSTVSNVDDHASYGSYIDDIGAGAKNNAWTNITSYNSRIDTITPGSKGTAPAIYIGAASNTFSNVRIIAPEGDAIWADYYSQGSVYNKIDIRDPGRSCLYIKGPGRWNNISCENPSTRANRAHAAIVLDGTFSSYSDLDIDGLVLSNSTSLPSYAIEAVGSHDINGSIVVNSLLGAKFATKNLQNGVAIRIDKK